MALFTLYRVNSRTEPQHRATTACFLASGAALLLVAAWFGMASIDYAPQTRFFPFRTSGWFIIGLVFTLPVAVGYAGLFLLVSRWVGLRISWVAMLAVSAVLIALAVRSALPDRRLKPILGDAAVEAASLEVLRIHDTFNDGSVYAGVISSRTDLMALIRQHRRLKTRVEELPLVHLKAAFPNIDLPEAAEVYYDNDGEFLSASDGRRVYFWHSYGPNRSYDEEHPPADATSRMAP